MTLSQDRSTIFFGGTIGLSGQIAPAATDQKVTITEFPMNRAPISFPRVAQQVLAQSLRRARRRRPAFRRSLRLDSALERPRMHGGR